MTDEKKITKGLDKELMQLIDAEMNDPVIGKLLNRNAAYVLGKEIKILFIDRACEWLERALPLRPDDRDEFIEQFKQAMKGE